MKFFSSSTSEAISADSIVAVKAMVPFEAFIKELNFLRASYFASVSASNFLRSLKCLRNLLAAMPSRYRLFR